MNERQCQHIERVPIYIKRIGDFVIDKSEYENERGAFFRYEEIPCRLVADGGHQFCPKHELLNLVNAKIEGREL